MIRRRANDEIEKVRKMSVELRSFRNDKRVILISESHVNELTDFLRSFGAYVF